MNPSRVLAKFAGLAIVGVLLTAIVPVRAQQESSPAPLARLEETYAQEMREKVDAGYNAGVQKLNDAYRGALEAALKRVSSAGLLDDAVALKTELTRFAAETSVPERDAPATQADIARLRQAWRLESDRLQKQRSAAAKPIVTAYLERLRLLEVELTKAVKLEEAQAVREKRTLLAKSVAESAPPAALTMGPPVATGTRRPGLAIVTAARPVERAEIYASGCNNCMIYVNGKELMKVTRDKAGKLRSNLREGTIITVKIPDRFSDNSFWLSAISTNDEFLFDTTERWIGYSPADLNKWWLIKGAKEEKPAGPATEGDEYIGLVKKSAGTTPHYHGAQPIHAPIEAAPRQSFLYFVVTKQDLIPKNSK